MKRVVIRLMATLGLAAGMIAVSAAPSEAALISYICDSQGCGGTQGVNWIGIVDNGVGDSSPIVGSVVAVGVNIGGFIVTINNSTSKPLLAEPSMDISFSATTLGTGHIWLYATDDGFTTGGTLFGTLDGNSASTGSVQGCIYGGTNNVIGTLANQACSAFAPLAGSFSTQLTHAGATVNPYAMTISVEVIATSPGITSGDFLVSPEPATMGLFGLALFGLGGAVRRRFTA